MSGRRRALALVPSAALLAGLLAVAPAQATFPGDNGKVVWSSATFPEGPSDPVTGDIWMANADGTGAMNLTGTPNDEDNYPSVSPDGKHIAFASDRDGAGDLDLFMMDLETKSVTPLPSTANDEGWTAFSPDGTELAFVENDGSKQTIKVLNLNSGNKRTIGEGWHPNWSPNGAKIAFIRATNGANDIMVVGANGGTAQNLTGSPGVYEFGPDWSPDGGSIVYSSDQGTGFESVNLWIMDAGGFGTEQITDLQGWESEPSYSPDGTQLVFTHSPNPTPGNFGGQAIYTASTDGSGMELVFDSALIEDHPQWQVLGGGSSKVDTTLGVAAKNVKKKTTAMGFIDPEIDGAEIVVTYYKKKGTSYQPLQTKYAETDGGNFKTSFKRKKGGQCLLTADFYGDSGHNPSTSEVKFKC